MAKNVCTIGGVSDGAMTGAAKIVDTSAVIFLRPLWAKFVQKDQLLDKVL